MLRHPGSVHWGLLTASSTARSRVLRYQLHSTLAQKDGTSARLFGRRLHLLNLKARQVGIQIFQPFHFAGDF